MHRVSSVIDTWYDSGAMPFAQFHYPFEGKEEFDERFPADYICEAQDQTRGWFYTLLAESTLLFDQSSFKNCVCLGLILDPEGQKMSKSRGNVVDPWDVLAAHGADAFRWYYLTTQQPWAGYRFSLETVGESVRQFMLHALEHVLVLGALRERRGDRPRRADSFGPQTAKSNSRSSPTSTAGRSPGCRPRSRRCASGWTTSTAPPPGGRSPSSSRSSPTGTCGSRAAASGRATGPPSRPCATCLLETAKMLAPFTPFLADEIYRNLAGGADGEFGEAPDSVHLADFPQVDEALLDPELEAAMAAVQRTVRLGHAARAAAQGESAPAAAPRRGRRQRGRAGGDRGARRPGHRRAEREGARLRLRGGRTGQLRR